MWRGGEGEARPAEVLGAEGGRGGDEAAEAGRGGDEAVEAVEAEARGGRGSLTTKTGRGRVAAKRGGAADARRRRLSRRGCGGEAPLREHSFPCGRALLHKRTV